MGILKQQHQDNILTRNGFTFTSSSVTGALKQCYERCIRISKTYTAWVAVNIDSGQAVIYVEYECGGQVSTYHFSLVTPYQYEPYEFFEELDKEVTDYISTYK